MTERHEEELQGEESPANPKVLSKYQTAAELANRALAFALGLVQPGASILDICRRTDEELTSLAAKVTSVSDKEPKGIAFPCAISVNNVLCYCAPADASSDVVLQTGDMVKIELGAHVSGFPVLVANTTIAGATRETPATGAAAELLHATHLVTQAAQRMVRAGQTGRAIATALSELASELGVQFVEGMISHSMTKNRLSADKSIIFKPSEGQARVPDCTLAENDVFAIDIALASNNAGNGMGKLRPSERHRTTIYKRTGDTYSLRLKTSRAVCSEIQSRFGTMAFHIRSLEDATRARMALNECTKNGVTSAYDVLEAKPEILTARLMFTTILAPSGPLQLSENQFHSELIKPTITLKNPKFIELVSGGGVGVGGEKKEKNHSVNNVASHARSNLAA